MVALLLLISVSILVAVGFLAAFLKAAKSGQFDDTTTPAMRILFDEKISSENSTESSE